MLYWDLLTSLSLLKSEKIPALLYVGKGPEYVQALSGGIFDLFALPTGLGQRSQIVKGLVLRPFSYT